MDYWGRISRDDLIRWADSHGAKALPELIRRLIHETGAGVEIVDMPGGTGVALAGHDGFVRTASATPFVPNGTSVWELSVKKSSYGKATEDYEKRLDVPDGSPTAAATYIQVICRPWTKARSWEKDRMEDARWHEVRGYNVDRVTAWLEQAPATRLWFLEGTGRSPVGTSTASAWWRRWSTETTPPLAPELPLYRSEQAIAGLMSAIRRPGISTISGPIGSDEIVASTIAAIVRHGKDMASRSVVVSEEAAMQRLLAEPSPMVLVAVDGTVAQNIDPAVRHTVLVPVPQSENGDVVLDRLDG